MDPKNETAYCGIYCPDCIRYKNKFTKHASQLKDELKKIEFDKYAEIKTPFGANFEKYNEFIEVLYALDNAQCKKPCRVGGGCSGTPCKIIECCISRGFEGCWDCTELDECENLTFYNLDVPKCLKIIFEQ